MKSSTFCGVLVLLSAGITILAFKTTDIAEKPNFRFPYKAAGLSEKQAAAHLISRFSFGATPDMVDSVVHMGLEKWFANQLQATNPDPKVSMLLEKYYSLKMNSDEIFNTYLQRKRLVKMFFAEKNTNKDSISKEPDEKLIKYKEALAQYATEHGFRSPQEQRTELTNQKIIRAIYSNNQLKEVLANFWFNHFNITIGRPDCASFATVYDQQTIRSNVLGNFESLLMATAKSPAMLLYLDNANSIASKNEMTDKQKLQQEKKVQTLNKGLTKDSAAIQKIIKKSNRGLNENYARELLELHTLGVDGGYTQTDVTQTAKVFTGWTINPMKNYGGQEIITRLERLSPTQLYKQGYVHEGDFVFLPNRHDKSQKLILGQSFTTGQGYNEGEQLLKMLALHPNTARFICTKLAVRFVNDNPPASLINKMASSFLQTNGNIAEVLTTMACSSEFWSKATIREKTKSPFELIISALRSLNANVEQPDALFKWLEKMGEKIYYCQPPTGYPDKAQNWINTGSLLNRMNFGLALAAGRIKGVKIDLLALNNYQEPESAENALAIYTHRIMPERNMNTTIKRLTPLLGGINLSSQIEKASTATNIRQRTTMDNEHIEASKWQDDYGKKNTNKKGKNITANKDAIITMNNNDMLAQVVGIILGSPEFQRK